MSIVKKITKHKINNEKLYNLSVENDESFVVNGIVVHNCRSTLVPITKYEDYEADTHVGKEPIDKFIENNIGKGFSYN